MQHRLSIRAFSSGGVTRGFLIGIALLGMMLYHGASESAVARTGAASAATNALVVLKTNDIDNLDRVMDLARGRGGDVVQAFPPNAFVTSLNSRVERALANDAAVRMVEKGILSADAIAALGSDTATTAEIWNTAFRGVRDPNTADSGQGAPPRAQGSDMLIPPPELLGIQSVPDAPSSTQTSEFMAGKIVYSVIFVESNGGAGYCSPADPQTENWSAARQTTVLSELSSGLSFWTARANRPAPLTFVLDKIGTRHTSCEPINHNFSDPNERGKWIADVLTDDGYPATPANHETVARTLANDRRKSMKANWDYVILVVDSLNDADGSYPDGGNAFSDLNGPLQYQTYDNGGWGISRMHLVAEHEVGHTFGALDEYQVSNCSTLDSWGYLNIKNASCNNGGITTDISVMGEGSELANPSVDVSTSARGAIGWRNPSGNIVDVIRTTTVTLTPFTPDPTSDKTPTYSGVAGNKPFPPGGCNVWGGICYRTPSAVTISKVKKVLWRLDNGAWSAKQLAADDGKFNEENNEGFKFTPSSNVAVGKHTFSVQAFDNFGAPSKVKKDTLTIH